MCSLFTSSEQEIHTDTQESMPSYDDLSRRDVRSLVFHLLYAADAFDYQISLPALVGNFNQGFNLTIPLASELAMVTDAVIKNRQELEEMYVPYLSNWRVDRVSTCTRLILLFGIWELKYTPTDARIIINEAIELAKCFAEEDAYRFINGILDSIAKDIRKE